MFSDGLLLVLKLADLLAVELCNHLYFVYAVVIVVLSFIGGDAEGEVARCIKAPG